MPSPGSDGSPASPGKILRALLPAAIVAAIVAAMIVGGIARNRARVRALDRRQTGVAQLASYEETAVAWLASSLREDGTWPCDGAGDPASTSRILAGLRQAGYAGRPFFVSAASALRGVEGLHDERAGAVAESRGGEAAAYLAMLDGAPEDPAVRAFLAQAGEPPWEGRDTLALAILLTLRGRRCLAGKDPCHAIDPSFGRLASKMQPDGSWEPVSVPALGPCALSRAETTAAALGAVAVFRRILDLRAERARENAQSLIR